MNRVVLVLLAFVLLAAGAPAQSVGAKVPRASTINVDGRTRKYIVCVPPQASPENRVPLVFVLHPRGGSASKTAAELGFLEASRERGYIAVFPQARSDWKSGHFELRQDPSDLHFFNALLDRMLQEYPVDPERIHVVGQQTGGNMAYRLAGEYSDRIASFAVYGASAGCMQPAQVFRVPPPVRPVPLLHMHGMRDEHVPYGGASVSEAKWKVLASGEDSVQLWVDYTGCSKVPENKSLSGGRILIEGYPRANVRNFVVRISLVYQDQRWPGSKSDRRKRKDVPPAVDGATVVLDFFDKHPMR